MSDLAEIKRQVMVIAGYRCPGELMTKEEADMSLSAIVGDICSQKSHVTCVTVAMFLARELDK